MNPDTHMNLYRIIVLHGAPKDTHISTETYLEAPDEGSVAEWINQNRVHGHWFPDDDDEENMRCDDGPEYKEIPFREWVMKRKGDLDDDEGWSDAYYGVTKWGWEQIEGASPADIETLVRLGIAVQHTEP